MAFLILWHTHSGLGGSGNIPGWPKQARTHAPNAYAKQKRRSQAQLHPEFALQAGVTWYQEGLWERWARSKHGTLCYALPSTEMSWIANLRMMVQIIPKVIFALPSTISAHRTKGMGERAVNQS